MRLIDADAFVQFLKDTIIRQKYENLEIDGLLTVADVIEVIISDLDGTSFDGFKNAPTIEPERKTGADNECTYLTCKHGGFGDDACSKCRWAYRDMHEADEEGAQDGQT